MSHSRGCFQHAQLGYLWVFESVPLGFGVPGPVKSGHSIEYLAPFLYLCFPIIPIELLPLCPVCTIHCSPCKYLTFDTRYRRPHCEPRPSLGGLGSHTRNAPYVVQLPRAGKDSLNGCVELSVRFRRGQAQRALHFPYLALKSTVPPYPSGLVHEYLSCGVSRSLDPW